MAARAAAIPANNPITNVPYVLPLPALPVPPAVAADPTVDPLQHALTQPGAVTAYAAPAGPNAARPADLAALALDPAGAQPAAVPAPAYGGWIGCMAVGNTKCAIRRKLYTKFK